MKCPPSSCLPLILGCLLCLAISIARGHESSECYANKAVFDPSASQDNRVYKRIVHSLAVPGRNALLGRCGTCGKRGCECRGNKVRVNVKYTRGSRPGQLAGRSLRGPYVLKSTTGIGRVRQGGIVGRTRLGGNIWGGGIGPARLGKGYWGSYPSSGLGTGVWGAHGLGRVIAPVGLSKSILHGTNHGLGLIGTTGLGSYGLGILGSAHGLGGLGKGIIIGGHHGLGGIVSTSGLGTHNLGGGIIGNIGHGKGILAGSIHGLGNTVDTTGIGSGVWNIHGIGGSIVTDLGNLGLGGTIVNPGLLATGHGRGVVGVASHPIAVHSSLVGTYPTAVANTISTGYYPAGAVIASTDIGKGPAIHKK